MITGGPRYMRGFKNILDYNEFSCNKTKNYRIKLEEKLRKKYQSYEIAYV